MPISLAQLEEAIRRGVPAGNGEHPPGERRAAVAIVLRERAGEVEALLIRRSERDGDPWSGHAAFPGGRTDPGDPNPEATARRETLEEVGLDLAAHGARVLGLLQTFRPIRKNRGLIVTPVIFGIEGDPPLRPDPREVAATAWVPLSALAGGAHDGRYVYWWRPLRRLPIPVPMVLSCWRYGELTIWGLTHRMLTHLLAYARGA